MWRNVVNRGMLIKSWIQRFDVVRWKIRSSEFVNFLEFSFISSIQRSPIYYVFQFYLLLTSFDSPDDRNSHFDELNNPLHFIDREFVNVFLRCLCSLLNVLGLWIFPTWSLSIGDWLNKLFAIIFVRCWCFSSFIYWRFVLLIDVHTVWLLSLSEICWIKQKTKCQC